MKKTLKFSSILMGMIVTLFVLASCSSGTSEVDDNQLTGVYSIHVGGYDWGPGVDKVTVEFNKILDEIPKEEILIEETKEVIDPGDSTSIIEESFEREVVDAYYVDEKGESSEEPTPFVVFELYVSPEEGNPFVYNVEKSRNAWSDPYYLSFSLIEGETLVSDGKEVEEMNIEQDPEERTTDADQFEYDSFEAGNGTTFNYAHYSPETDTDTLFVWLHGGGEGDGVENTDPSVALLANKAAILANSPFQQTIGNAHVLVPQSPTMWLDMDGEGTRTTDGTSYYDESLKEMIDFYKEEVGASKVVLAGPSNGGYMVLRLAVLYPDAFDALIPICEGYEDRFLTDSQLEAIKDIPMFFIYSEDDDTLLPEEHTVPTVERLRKLDGSEIAVSSTETVIDTSGEHKDENGDPHQYDGHWSWVYFYNNESFADDNTPVFEWIEKQLAE
ncbi:hypothetical protein [Oceanobacillus sp. CFH 90083]|uniref:hypothetical protein n=1 Tax=Oceanobacillus sp. CFH 90083 TaxID=2592336 RepID=UPI00128B9C50|nr:hypothetical protein [Oceanobacillus sp. CFH 90083]